MWLWSYKYNCFELLLKVVSFIWRIADFQKIMFRFPRSAPLRLPSFFENDDFEKDHVTSKETTEFFLPSCRMLLTWIALEKQAWNQGLIWTVIIFSWYGYVFMFMYNKMTWT